MKAIQFVEKGKAALADVRLGSVPPGHALIRVKAAGLCHTDIDVLHARYGAGAFPLIPGHEFAGEVLEVASDVTCVRAGSRVAVDPNLPCGACQACQKGLTNLCRDLKAYGVSHDGGFCEFCIVRADHLHDIGDMPYDLAALAEPLACVLNGLGVAGITDKASAPSHALVFGAGPIGLLLGLALKSAGSDQVTFADINEDRLEFAAGLGFTAVKSGSKELLSRTQSFDLVADATGIPSVVEGMLALVADGGTALVFGVCAPETRVSVSPFQIFRRQLKVVGSHSLNRNIPQALSVLAGDRTRMSQLVTHRLPLTEMVPYFLAKPTDPATMKVQYFDG
jgi:threonine dehydrogenase-like Zn-dependent dehydrogenase